MGGGAGGAGSHALQGHGGVCAMRCIHGGQQRLESRAGKVPGWMRTPQRCNPPPPPLPSTVPRPPHARTCCWHVNSAVGALSEQEAQGADPQVREQ